MSDDNRYFKACNNTIAAEPIQEGSTRASRRIAGMELIDERLALQPLTVVFKSGEFDVGDVIYVDPVNAANMSWSKAVFRVDGKDFILVPEISVLLANVVKPDPFVNSYMRLCSSTGDVP